MRKFRWPLQRLLDVTLKREQAARAELFVLARQVAKAKQDVTRRQTDLADLLSELGHLALPKRMERQELTMRSATKMQQEIVKLQEVLAQRERQRKEKTQQVLKLRQSRQTLEKLRQQARDRYGKELLAFEQKQLDESASLAFVRKAAAGARQLALNPAAHE